MRTSHDLEKLKPGGLAAQTGVGVQTLHYYERIGLLPKPDRSSANYRLYPPAALRRVRFIKKAQAAGFTLDQIKEILDLQKNGAARCHRVIEIGRKRLREIDAQLDALKTFRESLASALPAWEKDTERRRTCAGEFCDLIEGLPTGGGAADTTENFAEGINRAKDWPAAAKRPVSLPDSRISATPSRRSQNPRSR